jgi:hypothetical protein
VVNVAAPAPTPPKPAEEANGLAFTDRSEALPENVAVDSRPEDAMTERVSEGDVAASTDQASPGSDAAAETTEDIAGEAPAEAESEDIAREAPAEAESAEAIAEEAPAETKSEKQTVEAAAITGSFASSGAAGIQASPEPRENSNEGLAEAQDAPGTPVYEGPTDDRADGTAPETPPFKHGEEAADENLPIKADEPVESTEAAVVAPVEQPHPNGAKGSVQNNKEATPLADDGCTQCGIAIAGKFCSECGAARPTSSKAAKPRAKTGLLVSSAKSAAGLPSGADRLVNQKPAKASASKKAAKVSNGKSKKAATASKEDLARIKAESKILMEDGRIELVRLRHGDKYHRKVLEQLLKSLPKWRKKVDAFKKVSSHFSHIL